MSDARTGIACRDDFGQGMAVRAAGAAWAYDADPARGDPVGRLRLARLPRRTAVADSRGRRPRLLRALQVALRGRQLRRADLRKPERLVSGRAASVRRQLLRDRGTARRHGTNRRDAARAGGDRRRLPARTSHRLSAGRPPGGVRRGDLSALHPLDRRSIQRASRDLPPARGGAGVSLGCGSGTDRLGAQMVGAGTAARVPRPGAAGVFARRGGFHTPGVDQGRSRTQLEAGAGKCRDRCPGAAHSHRALDSAQSGHPAPHGADLDRRRQGALRRHLLSGRWRIPAGEGDARAALPARDPRSAFAGARRSRPDAALQPRGVALSGPAARLGAGQARQAELLPLVRPGPGRLPGDDRAQGMAHVVGRDRRGDGKRRRAGRTNADRGPGDRRPRRARLAASLVGADRNGDAAGTRHRGGSRHAGGAAPQRGVDDADLSARRRGAHTADGGRIVHRTIAFYAGIFPAELTALRGAGMVAAVGLIAYAIVRRRSLRNADVLLLLATGIGLALVAGTEIVNGLLSAFSFEKGNGGRILGLAVFAIFVLFLLALRALSQAARNSRQLSAVLEGLAWEEFRQADLPERFRGKIAILIPAYNEADNIGTVLGQIPPAVCGVGTEVLVVDDGSRDGTGDVAAEHGAAVARHVTNRGGGAALRTGYRLMVESGALIVVTLDADGQHRPDEMERLVKPILDGEVEMAHGSRVLGHADRNHFARELGIVFFNRLVSLITRTHVTDCSNGYRAVRTAVLPQLVLRQEQFHTSEFMIEAIKRGIPAKEVPITVDQRLHGHSKKPAAFRYGAGFANAIVRTWLR